MTEGHTDEKQSLVLDDEKQYDIMLRAITKPDDVSREMMHMLALETIKRIKDVLRPMPTPLNTIAAKDDANKLLALHCERSYTGICDEQTDDRDYCSNAIVRSANIALHYFQ